MVRHTHINQDTILYVFGVRRIKSQFYDISQRIAELLCYGGERDEWAFFILQLQSTSYDVTTLASSFRRDRRGFRQAK